VGATTTTATATGVASSIDSVRTCGGATSSTSASQYGSPTCATRGTGATATAKTGASISSCAGRIVCPAHAARDAAAGAAIGQCRHRSEHGEQDRAGERGRGQQCAATDVDNMLMSAHDTIPLVSTRYWLCETGLT